MPACSRLAASLLRIPSSPLKSSSPLLCTSSRRFHRVYSKPSISALDRTEMDSNIGNSRRKDVLKIFRTAISSVLPQQMLQNVLHIENDVLHVEDREYPLNNNVHIVGFGKAVAGMARVVEEKLGPHIVQGIVSIPHGLQATLTELGKSHLLVNRDSKIKVFEGAENNLPDQAAMDTALAIQRLAASLTEKDLLLVLISGGGSALLPLPCPGITLDEMLELTKLLSKSGATISDLNIIRKHVEVLKGGGLAREAAPAKVVSLILSDVVGDRLDIIASSPTVADDSSPQMCRDIIRKFDISKDLSPTVKHFLKSKEQAKQWEHKDTNNIAKENEHVQNVIVGSNSVAAKAACKEAENLGYLPYLLSTTLEGDARERGKMFGKLGKFIASSYGPMPSQELRGIEMDLLMNESDLEKSVLNTIVSQAYKAYNMKRGFCLIASGETTVQVKGKGCGGRSQEMALFCALELDKEKEKLDKFHVEFLSGGTDGQDGPTDAAGGTINQHFVEKCRSQGLDVEAYLDDNDSYNLLKQVSDCSELVKTGLTGTNVMDLQILTVTLKQEDN